jgi:hypothetical protein
MARPNDKHDKHGDIAEILQEVYVNTQPPDSWSALRKRIDAAILDGRGQSHFARRQLVFWRRAALAMAACLVAAVGLLLYVAVPRRLSDSPDTAANGGFTLLTQTQTDRLVQAFSQVRGLFADQQPWLMIDSAGASQMGLTLPEGPGRREEGLVVLRLTVQETGREGERRYADFVAYPGQQVVCTLQTAAGSNIELRLVSVLGQDGGVDIDFVARVDGDARAGRVTQVGRNAFSSFAQLRLGANSLSLGATARPIPPSGARIAL